MSTTAIALTTMWTDQKGVPERFFWEAARYRVTDTPTPLELDLDAMTHLTTIPLGWRFQGTDEDGIAIVFDVVSFDDGREWHVIRTYR